MALKKANTDNLLHLVRYGTPADQKYLLGEFLETYDAVVLNANIITHAPAAISTFLYQHTLSKGFIIDPQTFAFQKDLKFITSKSTKKSKGKIKKPYLKLAEIYGDLFSKKVNKGTNFHPKDVLKEKTSIVKNVCNFQTSYLKKQSSEDEVEKYYEFLEEEGVSFNRAPMFLVAPYFYLDLEEFEDWLTVNIELIKETTRQFPGEKIAAQVVIDRELLSYPDSIKKITDVYKKSVNVSTVLVWIDDYHEDKLTAEQIIQFSSFINGIGAVAPVYNLYGGFLSVILGRTALVPSMKGVCHSIEYGEKRSVFPVGGGVPVSKFYLPRTFLRYLYRDVVAVVQETGWLVSKKVYHRDLCACATCEIVIQNNPTVDFAKFGETSKKKVVSRGMEVIKEFPTGAAKDLCKKHYMYCKHIEFSKISFANVQDVISAMSKAKDEIGATGRKEIVSHLIEWSVGLEQLKKK